MLAMSQIYLKNGDFVFCTTSKEDLLTSKDFRNLEVCEDERLPIWEFKSYEPSEVLQVVDMYDKQNENQYKKVGKRLKELRRSHNKMTQGYVAGVVDVTKSKYADYENGRKQVPCSILKRLAKFFDVDLVWLEWGMKADAIRRNF